ncbi:uncharacterized protein CXQ87_001882 [Candidozyma duobushaemuli]|uniref:SHSP domain-containing protein n=2 Tax=Candidozyma TaxID=3303203 RepID=A0ABX8I4D7_9ASCO|nr:uncharacterized protein CXQ87_001882 [[Candida] duobushaemulonis]PVH13764.1 hypothetical protein CXQ87_001882 [[Candida] duobushaemulonis]QWU88004.1 hypothetical protein CA3LBN_002269 [[Candida] haemuloni]
MYYKPRYNRKSHRAAGRSRPARPHHRGHRGRRYSGYHYPQPSNSKVYIEEPETEEEEESGSEYDVSPEDEVYEFGLDDNSDNEYADVVYDDESDFDTESESDGKEEVFIIANDDVVDINDILAEDALNYMEAEGALRDVNDDLVRYYDSDSESSDSDLSSEVSEASDDDSEIDVELDSEIEDLQKTLYLLSGEADDDSVTDLEIDTGDELEDVRQTFADELDSSDEEDVSDLSSDSDDDVFFEVGSDYDSSDDESSDDDIAVDEYLSDSDSSDSDSSDDEGITIYRHRFDLPDRYDSDNDSTDEELALYQPEQKYLLANDSDDEFDVIDLTKDLKDSKDCEVLELDDNTYKLNLRLPSLIKEDLKIDFSKAKNELVITGKFSFTGEESEESDVEEEVSEVDKIAEALEAEEPEAKSWSWSSSSESDSSDSESSDSDSDSDSSSSSSSSSESESDSDEEVVEDAQDLIKDFQNQEIQFEKHFVFDKIIKADEIQAKFLANGELEMILPNEGVEVNQDTDKIAITIESADEAAEPAEDVAMEE